MLGKLVHDYTVSTSKDNILSLPIRMAYIQITALLVLLMVTAVKANEEYFYGSYNDTSQCTVLVDSILTDNFGKFKNPLVNFRP